MTLPRMRDCTFSSATFGVGAREERLQHVVERGVRGLDRHRVRADLEVARERFGVGDAVVAGVARRHEHADDVLGAERVDRDRGDDRRVDPARERDQRRR